MDIRTQIGQRLAFGFQGETLSEEFCALVRKYKIGNVILFRENMQTVEKTRALCRQIQQLITESTGIPAIIAADEEGGMVSRVPQGAVAVPGNMAVAATGEPRNAYIAARIAARQLKGLGVNCNLAPVLDVNCNPANPVIGVRAWGDSAQAVTAYPQEAICGYAQEGMLCCGKHFPGHGDTRVDSHLGLPCIDKPMHVLEQMELKPFEGAIRAGIPAIMSAHILFPQLEQKQIPATMSGTILTGLLRERMGFDGLIFSDCMTMEAIRRFYGAPQGVVATLAAGVDIVFVGHDMALQEACAQAAYDAALRGAWSTDVSRILACKQKYAFDEPMEGMLGRAQDAADAEKIARQAVTWVTGEPLRADARTFFCGCADYRASLAGNALQSEVPFVQRLHEAFGGPYGVTTKDPDAQEIERAVKAAAGCEQVVVATLNAHLLRGQLALVGAFAQSGRRVLVAAMRNPYDVFELPQGVCALAAYDNGPASQRAVMEVLRGGACTGTLPIQECVEKGERL